MSIRDRRWDLPLRRLLRRWGHRERRRFDIWVRVEWRCRFKHGLSSKWYWRWPRWMGFRVRFRVWVHTWWWRDRVWLHTWWWRDTCFDRWGWKHHCRRFTSRTWRRWTSQEALQAVSVRPRIVCVIQTRDDCHDSSSMYQMSMWNGCCNHRGIYTCSQFETKNHIRIWIVVVKNHWRCRSWSSFYNVIQNLLYSTPGALLRSFDFPIGYNLNISRC